MRADPQEFGEPKAALSPQLFGEEFPGIWEQIRNPAFNYGDFATNKTQALSGMRSEG